MSNDKSPQVMTQDKGIAIVSILYLLVTLGFFSWMLFDVWIDAHTLARVVGYNLTPLQTPYFHLIAYTVIGGAIGGIVNGIRSFLLYYSAFDRVYFWKYITAPWMGAALAIIGFALLQSTVAIFGGTATNVGTASPQFLANFAVGALAGYGSRDVFIWLDKQASKLFADKAVTPDVTGQPASVAASQIHSRDLSVGAVAAVPVKDAAEEGKVVDQVPAPGTMIESGQSVDMVVGVSSNGEKVESGPENSSENG